MDVAYGFYSFKLVKIGFCAVVALGSICAFHIKNQKALALPKGYGYFYYFAANLMLLSTLGNMTDPTWHAVALVLQGLICHRFAMEWNDKIYAVPGFLSAYYAACTLIMAPNWESSGIAMIVAALYFGEIMSRDIKGNAWLALPQDIDRALPEFFKAAYAYAANIMLTVFILKQVPTDFVSPGLGLEGIGLLLAGFLLKEKLYRYTGLAILALLTGKLFFVDFAQFNTIQRVASFTVAGLVFLLSSYGYAFFNRSFEEETADEDAEESSLAPLREVEETVEPPSAFALSHEFCFEI
jgi:hypothetical protein